MTLDEVYKKFPIGSVIYWVERSFADYKTERIATVLSPTDENYTQKFGHKPIENFGFVPVLEQTGNANGWPIPEIENGHIISFYEGYYCAECDNRSDDHYLCQDCRA